MADFAKLCRMLDRRHTIPSGLEPRDDLPPAVVWCADRSQTFIIVTAAQRITGYAVQRLLSAASQVVLKQIDEYGDGLVSGGTFDQVMNTAANSVAIYISNRNNHQLTRGVLAAALSALDSYMNAQNFFGAMNFYVWDGANEIASGMIGLVP